MTPDRPSDDAPDPSSGDPADQSAGEPVDRVDASRATDGDASPASDSDADSGESQGSGEAPGREVVVPMRIYKTVTVFSTLLAMVGVVGGFVLLDAATDRGTAGFAEIDFVLAFGGLGAIVFAALVYAYSTRFRAPEMGKSKADTTQADDNG